MIRCRVNGQKRSPRRLPVLLAVALSFSLAACPTVQRYGPDEGAPFRTGPPKTRPVAVTPRAPQTSPKGPEASLSAQLGDGLLASELIAGARRLIGFAFPGRDINSFVNHLKTVAVWDGQKVTVAEPRQGDLWFGSGDRVAVVEGPAGGGAHQVVGPQVNGTVARFEVHGGRFWRATGPGRTN